MEKSSILKLPTRWVTEGHDSEELAELEKMGVNTDNEEYSELGNIYVFSNHITAFNKGQDGQTTIRLTDGNVYKILMPFKEFYQLINQ